MYGIFRGLKKRILWAGLLPILTLVVSTCLLSTLLANAQLHQRFVLESKLISEQVALLVSTMLANTDRLPSTNSNFSNTTTLSTNTSAPITQVLRSALQLHGVYSLRLVTKDGDIVHQAGPPFRIASPATAASQGIPIVVRSDAIQIMRPLPTPGSDPANRGTPTDFWLEIEFSRRDLLPSEYQWYLLMITLAVSVLLLATITLLRLANSLSFPLERLTAQISQINLHNLHTRLTTDDNTDLRPLQLHINHLLARIQIRYRDMREEVELAGNEIQKNMEALELTNAELDYSRKQAVEANQSKSMFLANISHEMHTPLNSILGYCRLLEKSALAENQRNHLHTLRSSAETLKAIISDILDFSKIEAGKLSLEYLPFNLRVAVDDALAMNSPSAHSKNLEIHSIFQPNVPCHVVGDANRLKQIISNLLSNAIKFTEQGSVTIEVSCQRLMDEFTEIRVAVKDTGIGIHPKDGRHLFQAFSRVDSALNRNSDGTGLGLVICKSLVKQMRGDIDFTSEPGKGSTFWFTLFLALDQQPQIPANTAPELCTRANKPKTGNLRILAVDDNLPNLKLLTTILEEMGVAVDSASSGYEAIEQVRQNDYQMIFMDIRMPGMDGVETTRRIRALRPHNYLPIIALTAHAMMDERTRLLASCFDDYQTKPINEQQLLHLINYWTQPLEEGATTPRFPRENPVGTKPLPVSPDNSCHKTLVSPVDYEDGLQRTDGRRDLAQELLTKLLTTLPKTAVEIEQLWRKKDFVQLHECVHKLHGATLYCGVPDLRESCKNLETLLSDHPTAGEEPFGEASLAVENLLLEINRLMIWQERNTNFLPQ